MMTGLATISNVIGAGDEPPNAASVQIIHETAGRLVKSITGQTSAAQ
jgi:hypothetical protein